MDRKQEDVFITMAGDIIEYSNVETDDIALLKVLRRYNAWLKLLDHKSNAVYPIFLTRDFEIAKKWVKDKARGTERYGLLASSEGKRLRAEGIWVPSDINHVGWFLNGKDNVDSSYYLEVAASEFKVQGLEVDYAILAWDADFRYTKEGFDYFKFRGTKWNHVNQERRQRYLKNAYRVLLTRARQGLIIYVPEGWDIGRVTIYETHEFDGDSITQDRVCYGGLDLSSTTDITAFVLVFPPLDEDDKFCILPYFWIPEDTLELRVRRDHVPYDVWERQGFLETTEGNVVHYGYIEKFIERLGERFNIREIAFDRWGAVQMVQNLEGMGFTVVPFGQGFKDMSPPTKELMKLTLEQKLAHGGHPVLRWMMDNIYIRTDPAGNVKADKEKSTEKIDGAVATIMGLDRAIRCGNNTGASVYDDRGILFI